MDHFIPLSLGMSPGTVPQNMIPSCHAIKGALVGTPCCNQSKRNHMPSEWLVTAFGARKAKVKLKKIEAFFAAVKTFTDAQESPPDSRAPYAV